MDKDKKYYLDENKYNTLLFFYHFIDEQATYFKKKIKRAFYGNNDNDIKSFIVDKIKCNSFTIVYDKEHKISYLEISKFDIFMPKLRRLLSCSLLDK